MKPAPRVADAEAALECPHCGAPISLADTNVATDLALCRACGQSSPFSSLAQHAEMAAVDLASPPKGVRVGQNLLSGIELTYRRLSPVLFFLIPFTAFWSGLSLSMIYGPQFMKGKFDPSASLSGLPFLIGTVVLLAVIAFLLFGHWRIRIDRGECGVFCGVGPFGRRRRIPLGPGSRVSLEMSAFKVNNVPRRHVVVSTGGRGIKFGATLPGDVLLFMAAVLQKAVPAA